MGNSVSLEEELINLRLTSKQMQRASKKCEKNEKAAVLKLKKVCVCFASYLDGWVLICGKMIVNIINILFIICIQAIQQGNSEGARIYAQVRLMRLAYYLLT